MTIAYQWNHQEILLLHYDTTGHNETNGATIIYCNDGSVILEPPQDAAVTLGNRGNTTTTQLSLGYNWSHREIR